MPGTEKCQDRGNWPAQREWLLKQAPAFAAAARPIVQELEIVEGEEEEDDEVGANAVK